MSKALVCPACGGNRLLVELKAIFAWDGKMPALGPEHLCSDEFPIEPNATVLCNGCGRVSHMHEMMESE